ncbi:MAG: acetylglucosamine-6-sulfatase [Planctomycetaceae bacterium]|nr:acetylglucosamine-6-sulfatase [Planctomycetaceae bacterium]
MKRILALSLSLSLSFFLLTAGLTMTVPAADENHLAVQSVSGMNETGWRSFWKPRFEQKFKQAEAEEIDIVLLGDSITNFWEGNGKDAYAKWFGNRKVLNLGFSGDRTQHTIWIVKDSGILDKIDPKLFVLMIGTNNVGWNETDPAQTQEGIREILRLVREKKPNAKIVLFSVFPRGANSQDKMRQLVNQINEGVPAMADGENIFYVDINPQLLEADGDTLSRGMMPDLLHPGAKGYEIWGAAIDPFVKKYVEGK